MSFSDYLELELLDHILGGVSLPYSPPANVFVALSTTTPTDAGGNFTEPSSGNGYARVQVANNSTNWPAASSGSKSNGTTISFPQATGSWGTVTYFGVFDQLTGGNCLMTGQLTTSKSVGALDTVQFSAGNLTVTLD